MTGKMKLLVGVVATSLLAFGAHAYDGDAFIGKLQEDGKARLASTDLGQISLVMAHNPLSRIAILDGPSDQAMRARAEEAVLSVPGIAGVRWADEGGKVVAMVGGDSAEAGKTIKCQADVDKMMAGKVINFKSGSAYMADRAKGVVKEVAGVLSQCGDLKIEVGGHTDALGSELVNKTLSQARADAVAAVLAESGIAANRITAVGYGAAKPVAAGTGASEANRRIEFVIVKPATQGGE